jgi:hypothetical protein
MIRSGLSVLPFKKGQTAIIVAGTTPMHGGTNMLKIHRF